MNRDPIPTNTETIHNVATGYMYEGELCAVMVKAKQEVRCLEKDPKLKEHDV